MAAKIPIRADFIARILEAARGGASKTTIMSCTFIEFARLREYLETLVDDGLLNISADSLTYRTSNKGIKYLNAFEHVSAIEMAS
jgi:predicted transcriptional regulator